MTKISVLTFATWEEIVYPFVRKQFPLNLEIHLKNNTRDTIIITNMCVSMKNKFWFDKEILPYNKNISVLPNNPFIIPTDIYKIANEYDHNKRFTIKITDSNGETYESNIMSIQQLKNIKNMY